MLIDNTIDCKPDYVYIYTQEDEYALVEKARRMITNSNFEQLELAINWINLAIKKTQHPIYVFKLMAIKYEALQKIEDSRIREYAANNARTHKVTYPSKPCVEDGNGVKQVVDLPSLYPHW